MRSLYVRIEALDGVRYRLAKGSNPDRTFEEQQGKNEKESTDGARPDQEIIFYTTLARSG